MRIEQVEDLLDEFDFDKVKKVMDFLSGRITIALTKKCLSESFVAWLDTYWRLPTLLIRVLSS
jgi:hypothetical protein